MVAFKIYDKKKKKFVGQHASAKVWRARYDLGIWNYSVNVDKLGEMYKIMKRNDKHLELYVKNYGRFKPVSKEVIDNVVKEYKKKEPERKETRRRWKNEMEKEKSLTRRVGRRLRMLPFYPRRLTRRVRSWFKTSKTKKK
jgi:hypothetical protein